MNRPLRPLLIGGLSPAWQQIVELERLAVGEVNRAQAVHWQASGKVLNVAAALGVLLNLRTPHIPGSDQQKVPLGQGPPSPTVVCPVGGAIGELLQRDADQCIHRRHVTVRWVPIKAPTRVCTTLLDRQGQVTELVENASELSAEDVQSFRRAWEQSWQTACVAVLTGSLPIGTKSSFYQELIADQESPPAATVLDLRGPELVHASTERPTLVKPNRNELMQTVGRTLSDESALLAAIEQLHRWGAQGVLVSDGPRPAWLSWRAAADGTSVVFNQQHSADHPPKQPFAERELMPSTDTSSELPAGRWLLKPPVVQAINPIGCGDCLTAGVALGLARGLGLVEAVRLGLGAAAANAETLRPAEFTAARAKELSGRVQVEPEA